MKTKKEVEAVDPHGAVGDDDNESDDDGGDKKIAATVLNKEAAARQLAKRDTIWEHTCRNMRSGETMKRYIKLLDLLIQGVVTYKRYKMNRTIKPFSEWVTVSDEAFLLLCLENYGASWTAEVDGRRNKTGDRESNETTRAAAKYTGRDKGTRVGWSDDGIKEFNNAMTRVFLDREKHGKSFDEQFTLKMKERYERKLIDEDPESIAKHNALLAEANARVKNRQVILNDHNIAQHIERNRQLLEQQMEQAVSEEDSEGNNDEMLESSSGNDDSDDDEEKTGGSVYQL